MVTYSEPGPQHNEKTIEQTPVRSPRPVGATGTGASSGITTWFGRVAGKTSYLAGTAWAFLVASAVILLWAVTGPMFHFSNTWQLVINTGTTIVTFLMVFLIQNTQNRDAKAIHIKLDELLRAVEAARNDLIDIEEDSEDSLEALQATYRTLKEVAPESGTPPMPPSGDEPSLPKDRVAA